MEILVALIGILVIYLVIRGAVHEGTPKALIEFEKHKTNNKNKIELIV